MALIFAISSKDSLIQTAHRFQLVEPVEGIMYERFAKSRIEGVLADTRVVLISVPRQFGKTTLAIDIAVANDDPVEFLRRMDRGASAILNERQILLTNYENGCT